MIRPASVVVSGQRRTAATDRRARNPGEPGEAPEE